MKRKILVVYAALNHPLRATTKQLIDCFQEYSDDHWFYVNLAHKAAPFYLSRIEFDLVVFHVTFMQRLSRSEAHFQRMTRRAACVLDLPVSRRVALVQDEFWNASKVERFLLKSGVNVVFSVSPDSEWRKIYPRIDPGKVRFHRVLTGYLDDNNLDMMIALGENPAPRKYDLVYRASNRPSPAWGRFGYLKQDLTDAVVRLLPNYSLQTDISTAAADVIHGNAWYEFLASSRYTFGVESGVSLLDRDGEINARVSAYRTAHPAAEFEEIEATCFPGMDGNIHMAAIGPRHLEACATRTCQILTEGDYNGLLKPGLHYIPLSRDLANLPEVLGSLGDEDRRRRLVKRAFDDIVAPRKLTYANFVREVLDVSFSGSGLRTASPISPAELRILKWMQRLDEVEWAVARHVSKPVRGVRDFLQKLARGRPGAPAV